MDAMGVLVGIIIIGFMSFFAVLSSKELMERKKEIRELQKKIEEEEKHTEIIIEHEEAINEINEDEIKGMKEIENAKTKEELRNIARNNANDNNDIVRKQTKSGKQKKDAATKA